MSRPNGWGPEAKFAMVPRMEHKLRLLSQLGQCRVEGCSCGVVHLSLGAVSIRLSTQQATDLAQAMRSASREFGKEAGTVTADQVPGNRSSDEGDEGPPDGHNQIH